MPNWEITARSSCREISYPSRQGEELSSSIIQDLQEGSIHPEWVRGSRDGLGFTPRSGHFLIYMSLITEQDIKDFRQKGKFGFVQHDGVTAFLVEVGRKNRFPLLHFSDSACECCSLTYDGPGSCQMFTFSLVEAETGIVRALRVATLSTVLTEHLQTAVRMQREVPSSEFDDVYSSFHRRFPTWSAMMRSAIRGRLGR